MAITRRRAIQLTGAALAGVSSRASLGGSTPRRLLILGGTSFLGPHLTQRALAAGWDVTHFNRGRRAPEGVPGVETLHGDRDGPLDVLQGRQWDAVIDTSGYIPRHVRLSAGLLAPAIGRYVFISSISVYAGFATPNDETSPVGRLDDDSTEEVNGETYGPLKALCEQAAQAALPGRTIVIRPGLIVGPLDPTDRFTYWPVRVARGGEVLAPGKPTDPIQVIDVRDLADWTLGLLERGVEMGTFNAVSPPRRFTIGGLLEDCQSVAAGDARLTWVDAGFLDRQKVSAWSDMPVWVPPTGEDAAMSITPVDRAVAQGLTFRPLVESARDTLEWHRTRPEERRQALRAGLDAAREQAVLAAWHATQGASGGSAG